MTARHVLLAGLASLALSAPALAVPVYGTAAALTGTRTEGAGIVTGGDYFTDGNTTDEVTFRVSWEITPIAGGYEYEYTFSGYGSPAISHFILDLTDDCVGPDGAAADPGCVANAVYAGGTSLEFKDDFGPGEENPGFPGGGASIGGVKFDNTDGEAPFTVTFESNRAPVWGDFYVKAGSDNSPNAAFGFAYNTGLENHASEDVNDFIARPNGATAPVPEPGTLAMLGLGLAGLRQWSRRKRS
jgi:hypothetical protein